MEYYLYLINTWKERYAENIVKERYITFPTKHCLSENDIIFICCKYRIRYFLCGYVRVWGFVENNVQKIRIFDDLNFITYGVQIKSCYFFNLPIKLSNYIKVKNSESKNTKQNFDYINLKQEIKTIWEKYNTKLQYFFLLSESLGKNILENIKKNRNSTNKINKTEKKIKRNKFKNKNNENTEENPPIPIIKSQFIIPIMIIPCKKFYTKIKNIKMDDSALWIYKHITKCRQCNVTNNNDRVSLDTFRENKFDYQYLLMKNKHEIKKLLYCYYALQYCQMEQLKENEILIIKIYQKKNMYHKCYCLIGKLDEKR